MALITNRRNRTNNGGGKLVKKRLTDYEYKKWLEIGEIDMSQNWLELFTGYLMDDIGEIIHGGSDNQEKQGLVKELIQPMGFEDLGLGTNVYAVSNRHYPGVAFKIALDANGLADNFNDAILMRMVNGYLAEKGIVAEQGYEKYNRVLDRHNTGIVSVQDRKPVIISQDRMDSFRADILRTLNILADEFLIIDLSPNEYHLNYGVNRDGTWCFIDASDIYPIGHLKHGIRCTSIVGYNDAKDKAIKCGAPLQYSPDFSKIRCRKCGKIYFPAELRPADKGGKSMRKMDDGMTANERENMRVQQIEAMRNSGPEKTRALFAGDVPGKQKMSSAYGETGWTGARRVASRGNEVAPTPVFRRPTLRPTGFVNTRPATPDDVDRRGKPLAGRAGSIDDVQPEEIGHMTDVLGTDHGRTVSFDESGDLVDHKDSDPEETEEDGVEYSNVSEPAGDPHMVNAIGDEEEEDTGEPNFDEPVESGLIYTIVPVDSAGPDDVPGIYIKINGDVNTALDNDLLPIYVDGGDGIDTLVIKLETQRREILKVLSDE